jgi:hypothetical protein
LTFFAGSPFPGGFFANRPVANRLLANSFTANRLIAEEPMTDFEAQVLADLSVLKNQMTVLVGDGTAGRIGDIEKRVTQHEERFQNVRGVAIAFGALLTLIQFLIDCWRRK